MNKQESAIDKSVLITAADQEQAKPEVFTYKYRILQGASEEMHEGANYICYIPKFNLN